jgi:DNA-binding NtrC family response regulator
VHFHKKGVKAMLDGLNVIIVDDNKEVCQVVFDIIKRFYTWGEVIAFTDVEEAIVYCKSQKSSVAIFVVDVFLNSSTGFIFLDSIAERYPMAYEDAIMMSGNASDDVVNMCVAANITYLLEKPVKAYALQLAVRAIVNKYINFAKRLIDNPEFAEDIYNF